MVNDNIFDQSLFTYFIYKKGNLPFKKLPIKVQIDNYVLCLSQKTEFTMAEQDNRFIIIIGLCVDSEGVLSEGIPEYILRNSETLDDVLTIEKRMAGKYVFLYIDNGALYIIGDATCSMQVNYSIGKEFVISTSSDLIAEYLGVHHSEEYLSIRKKGDVSQALPNNITLYEEIKVLLPNYYYDARNQTVHRLDVKNYCINSVSVKDAAKKTSRLINNIATAYTNKYDVVCPLTAGWDSRVVLAYLRKNVHDLVCYTLKHKSHKGDEYDLVIPKIITEGINLRYVQIEDEEVPIDIKEQFDNHLGKGLYSDYTLMLAYTIKNNFQGKAIVNGDTIGQIGKSSLHRNIPDKWASPSYFMCKLHNYSKHAKKEMVNWYKVASEDAGNISVHDLFSWEIRLGRWVAQGNYIYNILGVPNLNIFNCRNVIYTWTQTNRGYRQYSELHKGILMSFDPELLEYPFEPKGNILFKIAKSNHFVFYIASFLKYWLDRFNLFRL